MKEEAKEVLADALVMLATEIIFDMKPYIEDFIANDLASAVAGLAGEVGSFLGTVVDALQPDAMSPAIASALPPTLPKSDIGRQFGLEKMIPPIRDASNAYWKDKGDEGKLRSFVESMVFAMRLVEEAKTLLAENPDGLTISLQDYADLHALAEEVSRFRNVSNFNEVMAVHSDMFGEELLSDLSRVLGREAVVDGEFEPIEPVQFRIDLYAMPVGRGSDAR